MSNFVEHMANGKAKPRCSQMLSCHKVTVLPSDVLKDGEKAVQTDNCDVFGQVGAKKMRLIQSPVLWLLAEQL